MIVLFSLLAVCIMSYYLIVTEDYDSGVMGHLALAGLSFSSGVGFAQVLCGRVEFEPVSQMFFVSTAVFEARHIYRIYKGRTKSQNIVETVRRLVN